MNNMGIRTRFTCFNYTLFGFFFTVRMIVAICMVKLFVVDFWLILCKTWTFNDDNWWKSDKEPFWTNDSIVNAFFAWVFYITNEVFIWILIPLLLIVLLSFICIPILTRSWDPLFQMAANIGVQLTALRRWTVNFLLGCSIDHTFKQEYTKIMSTENFLRDHRKGFGKLLFDDT